MGEQIWVKIDDKIVWLKKHLWCDIVFIEKCKKRGVNVCGGGAYPDQMGDWVSVTRKHTAQEVKITVGSGLAKGNCKATWGIDNVEVYIR